MEKLIEISELYLQMQPCAQLLLRDLAKKYAKRWPIDSPSLRPPLLLDGRQAGLDKVNNVINGTFAVHPGKVVDSQ